MRTFLIPLLWTLSLGCVRDQGIDDDDDQENIDDDPGDDSGIFDDSCSTDSDCPSWSICEENECIDGDRNNSVDEAERLLWDDSIDGIINPSEDVDYYTFEAEGGEFVYISIEDDEDEDTDLVIVLRKPNGKVLAMADNYATGTNVTGVDAGLFGYIPEAGSYSVSVEDAGSYYSGGDPEGNQDYRYSLSLIEWTTTTAEPDDAEQSNVTLGVDTERIWSSVGFVLEEEGDVDYVTVEYFVDDAVIYLDGNQYVDGSDLAIQMRLLNEEGEVVTDKLDVGPDGTAIYPAAPTGTYRIELSDALGSGGSEHWGFLHFITRTDSYVHDLESEPNDAELDANALTLEEYENSGGNLFRRGQADGAIDAQLDVDLYSFTATYDETWICTCVNSAEFGSAIAPMLEILDSAGEVVASAEGDAAQDPDTIIENHLLEPGEYYLRVSGMDETDGGPGSWYRFNFFAASFEVSSYADGGFSCPQD